MGGCELRISVREGGFGKLANYNNKGFGSEAQNTLTSSRGVSKTKHNEAKNSTNIKGGGGGTAELTTR